MNRRRRQLALLSCAVCFTAVYAEAASAAVYEVETCREETREALPTTDWSIVGPAGRFRARTDCATGPILAGPLELGPTAPGGEGGLAFSVPDPLAIVGFKYRQLLHTAASKYPPGQWAWDFESRQTTTEGRSYRTGGCPGQMVDGCSESYGVISYAPKDRLSAIQWMFVCSPVSLQPCDYASSVDVSVFDGLFKVDDPEDPSIEGQPGGAMFAGVSNLSGDQTVAFHATDAGGGIYRAVVEVDGVVVGELGLSRDAPSCHRPFRVAQPCPQEVISSVVVDTTRLADGQHDAYLKVYDASAQNFSVYGPVSFTSSNRTVASHCASENAARFKLRVPAGSLAFGKPWRFRARLKEAAGWEVILLDGRKRVSALGAAVVSMSGRVQFKVPAGSNRMVRLAIRPVGSREKYLCSQPRRVRVRPRITLSLSPRDAMNGSSVAIRGRLHGKAKARKAIVVQARARGGERWATVRVLRTGREGRYQMRYRFQNSSPGTTYLFRSQARAEKGYPYTTGTSPFRRLRIIGG